nr:hypothetical protein [Desertifilum tharense]
MNSSKSRQTALNTDSDAFDFDQWAREVRPQLLAALQRRGRTLSVYISSR